MCVMAASALIEPRMAIAQQMEIWLDSQGAGRGYGNPTIPLLLG